MPPDTAALLSAVVEVHGVLFELTAQPSGADDTVTTDSFRKYVDKLRRMVMSLSTLEAETLRDELLILNASGKGVALDQLGDHALSVSATASKAANEAAHIRIKALDPVLQAKVHD